ncbi:hypothetical protein LP316_11740 [Thalassotalea sp. LPB0316]|uniref:hypothetical protein n=1 Tax=Thalassotalea sp. LPB0316 TaxID=2769490 RepID=UPI001867936C|nr:hypothetical protein [Thalassotalea sp. LPB0316]QOL24974.1 hypothetical protein LP316_11740 [Thalassotalea sp. LPB0316]
MKKLTMLTGIITLSITAASAMADSSTKSVYECKPNGCVLEILSLDRKVIVHQNDISSITINHITDSAVEVTYIQNKQVMYVTTSLLSSNIHVSNGQKLGI